jgi:hypothetical protein
MVSIGKVDGTDGGTMEGFDGVASRKRRGVQQPFCLDAVQTFLDWK